MTSIGIEKASTLEQVKLDNQVYHLCHKQSLIGCDEYLVISSGLQDGCQAPITKTHSVLKGGPAAPFLTTNL